MDCKQSIKIILQKIHFEDANKLKHPQEPLEKIKIGKVKPWIVDNARNFGINIEGFDHEISNYFIRHVLKNHGDEQKENGRGNLSIKDEDVEQIPAILEYPDFVIFGAKRNNNDRIIYVKNMEYGTTLYFEEILTGKNNKSLRGNTMYKTKKNMDKADIIANIGMNGKTDLSNIKITGMDGGQSINTANQS